MNHNHVYVAAGKPFQHKISKFQKQFQQFKTMEGANDLSQVLGFSFDTIQKVINEPEYTQFILPKKHRGSRMIESPSFVLNRIQKKLNKFLQDVYDSYKPEVVFGFVLGAKNTINKPNIVKNAEIHVAKKYLLNLDLTNFFGSIHANRVKSVFENDPFGFNKHIATSLALLTTFKGHLPQGSPASPVVSNFVCFDMDKALQKYCSQHGIQYSRYADDLTFSSDIALDGNYDELKGIIQQHDFVINEQKIRWRKQSRKQTVTGITVNEKVNVDRHKLKHIRAMLHDLTLNGIAKSTENHFKLSRSSSAYEQAKFLNKLKGNINFVGQVRGREDLLYRTMKMTFGRVTSANKNSEK